MEFVNLTEHQKACVRTYMKRLARRELTNHLVIDGENIGPNTKKLI